MSLLFGCLCFAQITNIPLILGESHLQEMCKRNKAENPQAGAIELAQ